MPTYRITAPDGRTFRLTGDSPPTEQELEEIFERYNTRPLLGGPNARMSAGEPESALSRGYGAVKEAVFGHPDRAEAQAAGIGLQPTVADLGRTAVGLGAAGLAGGGAGRLAAMAGPGVARAVGAVGRVAMNPVVAGGAAGALDLMSGGDLKSAATEALLVGGLASGVRGAKATARPIKPIPPKAATKPKPVQQASRTEPPAASAKPAATAKPVSRGAEVAARHNSTMAFAKEVAMKNPKVGEKIHILLDDAGRPIKMLTSDEAGAATRKGLSVTWVRNLWRAQ